MDKYQGVYVKIILNNGDTAKGYINGKDQQGNLVLKDTIITNKASAITKKDLFPIPTTTIKDLEVLESNKPQQQQQQQQQQPQQQKQQQAPPPQPQFQHQPPFPQPYQGYPMYPQPFPSPMQFHHPSPQMPMNGMHMDPAILFHQQQQQQQQMNSPLLPRDPAIISSQAPSNNNDKSSKTTNTSTPLDPAIVFTHSIGQPNTQLTQTPKSVQQLFSSQQQEQQKQNETNSYKSIDPSILFQSQEKTQPAPKPTAFEDPAIISVSSTPESTKPKKPLFGGKKTNKHVKQIVVFEDYSEFEKDAPKKASPKSKTKQKRSKSPEKKLVQKMETLNIQKSTTRNNNNKTTTTTAAAAIPAALIPPRVKRAGSNASSGANTQVQQSPVQEEQPEVPVPRILTVSGGIQIPTVNANQMETAKLIGRETGLTQTQLVDNGAFGISMMILKAIGGHRRIQPDNHNAAPVVVILAGPTAIGESGIAAARHLANRGCQVIISMTENTYCGASVEQYKTLAKFSGVKIVYSLDELPDPYTTPVDIIVDALLGSELLKITPAIKKQMNWANSNKAPVLSVEFPSGVNPNDGSLPDPNHYIKPKWTLCLGAPYTGCVSRNITGELFLADFGLPFLAFEKCVPNFYIPWGSDFVLGLEYA